MHDNPEIKVTASWYHQKDILPYYLGFDISKKDEKIGYKILINLESLELIYVDKTIRQSNFTIGGQGIQLDESCLNQYNKRIKTIK